MIRVVGVWYLWGVWLCVRLCACVCSGVSACIFVCGSVCLSDSESEYPYVSGTYLFNDI